MCSCIDSCYNYTARLSPALNRSLEIFHFECSDAIEIRNGITFVFYVPGTALVWCHGSATALTDLQEPADGQLVAGPHGDHVLIEPEEGAVLARERLGVHHQTKELEEETTRALWRGRTTEWGVCAGNTANGAELTHC